MQQIMPRSAYIERVKPFIDTDVIKVLVGTRRGGKTTLLEMIQKELVASGKEESQIISINLEAASFISVHQASELMRILMERLPKDRSRSYVFLDEVQRVDGWEDVVNALRVSENADVFVSGSNAHLLSGELASHISGRYVEIPVYPYSFSEFFEAYRSIYPDQDERKAFQEYLLVGGMPYLQQIEFDVSNSAVYLQGLFSTIEVKDILQRCNVRDADLLDRLLKYVLANTGTDFSARSLERYLRNEGRTASVETILNYLRAGSEAFLYYRISRQDLRGKELLKANEKYYIADHGIREAVIGENMSDISLVLENIVCLELLRRGYEVTVGDNKGREIDFVGSMGSKRIYIQVAYLLASAETVKREFSAFQGLPDSFPRIVVSMDELDMSRDGVRHWNIRDFLLSSEWG